MKIAYKKRRKTQIVLSARYMDAEVGDLFIQNDNLYRLKESNGWAKAASGELTPCRIHPPICGMKIFHEAGALFWVDSDN
jgi:hypothetical protein